MQDDLQISEWIWIFGGQTSAQYTAHLSGESTLTGLSHEIDLGFDDILGLHRGRGQ